MSKKLLSLTAAALFATGIAGVSAESAMTAAPHGKTPPAAPTANKGDAVPADYYYYYRSYPRYYYGYPYHRHYYYDDSPSFGLRFYFGR